MVKNFNLFRTICFVFAIIAILFCVNIFNFAGAKSEYDGGTFEDFYAEVMELYNEYGDVNEGETKTISKDAVVEEDGEIYLSSSLLSSSDEVAVLSVEDDLVALSDTDFIVEENVDEYVLSLPSYTNRIIVRYEGNLPAYKTDAYAEGLGWHIYQYSSSEATEEAYQYYNSLSYIDFVEYDSVIVGDDTTSSQEVTSNSSNSYLSWGAYYTGIDEYLSYLTYIYDESELERVYVPILDSGINTSHELFVGRYSSVYGKNFTNTTTSGSVIMDENFKDDEGHGSHTSGIIADQTLDNVILIPCKVLKSNGRGSVTMIVTAIEYIISLKEEEGLNIRVMNMSLGVESEDGSPVYSASMEMAMREAYNADIMAVVSAGNSHYNTSSNTPANMYEEAIVVSALEEYPFSESGLNIASYSNYGSTVDLSAPGTHVYSAYDCCPRDYEYLDGTSMAAPHVTAAIANILSNPSLSSLSNDEIENLLYENAIDLGMQGKDIYYGYGCVNIANVGVETIGEVTFSETEALPSEPISLELFYTGSGNYQIYYTTDETSPSLDDTLYTAPIEISSTTKITAVAFLFNSEDDIVAKSKVTSMTYYFDNLDLESNYVVSGNSASGTLVQYNGSLTSLNVPKAIGDVAITNIANGAFSNTKVENITFLSENLIIQSHAFYGLNSLQCVEGEGIVSVGEYAFANCQNLTNVDVSSAYNIGNNAFKDCIKLTDLDLSNARTIGENALDELALNTLHLGANLMYFGTSYYHANTIYAYSITGFDETLKNYTDELVSLDMKFTEYYPTRLIFKSTGEATLTFTYYVNNLKEIDYRFANANNFDNVYGETIEVNFSTESLGNDVYQTTFTFNNLLAGSYGFQFYIYDNFGYVLYTDEINVIVLLGSEEEYALTFDEGEFEIYIDNMKVESGYLLYSDLSYEIQIFPNTSYYINNIVVNSESVTLDENNSFTIDNVADNINLSVDVLEIEEFNINFNVAEGVTIVGENGEEITGTATASRNDSFIFSVLADEAYNITYVEIDGVRQEIKDTYTLEGVLDNHDIEIGAQIKTYLITVNYGAGGSVSTQNSERVNYGDDKVIYLTTEEGYNIKAVYVNGEKVEVINDAITLTYITSDTAVTIQFEKEQDGIFEGTRLIIFILFCITLGIMIVSIITVSIRKANKKKKIS